MIKSITLLLKILIYLISIPAFCMSSNRISDTDRKRSRPVTKRSAFEKNKWLLPLLVIVIVLVLVASTIMVFIPYKEPGNTTNSNGSTTSNPIAVIDTSMGTIRVELYKDKVPNTANNFINLANSGFYDGLVFHRVINGFMIQGGGFDANGNQRQSPYNPINLEINPNVHHVDGTIAMARTSDPNSATSQFFIDDGPQPQLEPGGVDSYGYAVFGVVVQGLDVVHNIAAVQTTTKYGQSDWPVSDITIYNITIENG